MIRILVDIDHDELNQAMNVLGTTDSPEAVRLAIREVIAAEARRSTVEMLSGGAFADLDDPDVRGKAWGIGTAEVGE